MFFTKHKKVKELHIHNIDEELLNKLKSKVYAQGKTLKAWLVEQMVNEVSKNE